MKPTIQKGEPCINITIRPQFTEIKPAFLPSPVPCSDLARLAPLADASDADLMPSEHASVESRKKVLCDWLPLRLPNCWQQQWQPATRQFFCSTLPSLSSPSPPTSSMVLHMLMHPTPQVQPPTPPPNQINQEPQTTLASPVPRPPPTPHPPRPCCSTC